MKNKLFPALLGGMAALFIGLSANATEATSFTFFIKNTTNESITFTDVSDGPYNPYGNQLGSLFLDSPPTISPQKIAPIAWGQPSNSYASGAFNFTSESDEECDIAYYIEYKDNSIITDDSWYKILSGSHCVCPQGDCSIKNRAISIDWEQD
jgi:hypothetical protein